MATLHLLSRSPFSNDQLASCLRLLDQDDALLLTGDAVYALLPGSEPARQLAGVRLFALEEDLAARNLQPDGHPELIRLDYPGFVALTCQYSRVNSWL